MVLKFCRNFIATMEHFYYEKNQFEELIKRRNMKTKLINDFNILDE